MSLTNIVLADGHSLYLSLTPLGPLTSAAVPAATIPIGDLSITAWTDAGSSTAPVFAASGGFAVGTPYIILHTGANPATPASVVGDLTFTLAADTTGIKRAENDYSMSATWKVYAQ